jgi:hypothetical protein
LEFFFVFDKQETDVSQRVAMNIIHMSFSPDYDKHPLFSKHQVIWMNRFSCQRRAIAVALFCQVLQPLHALDIGSLQVSGAFSEITFMQVVDESGVDLPEDMLELLILWKDEHGFPLLSALLVLGDQLFVGFVVFVNASGLSTFSFEPKHRCQTLEVSTSI